MVLLFDNDQMVTLGAKWCVVTPEVPLSIASKEPIECKLSCIDTKYYIDREHLISKDVSYYKKTRRWFKGSESFRQGDRKIVSRMKHVFSKL